MVSRYIPKPGDLVWLEFNPQSGHEQAGRRPALVISQLDYNKKTGLALFCPVTSRKKGYPFEVDLKESPVKGVVLSDQVKSLDWRARKTKLIDTAPESILREALAKIRALLPA